MSNLSHLFQTSLRSVVVVVLRWIEAAGLIEPAHERQVRALTSAERAAFVLARWLALRAAQEAPLTGAPLLPGGCGFDSRL
jgi:hypothetical protein